MSCCRCSGVSARRVKPDDEDPPSDEDALPQDFQDWFWGHTDSQTEPPGSIPCSLYLKTFPLKFTSDSAYHEDVARQALCPHYLDRQAVGTAKGTGCPFLGGKAFVRHADIKERLAGFAGQFAAGKATRRNEIGPFKLDSTVFPILGTIGYGADGETHSKARKYLQDLLEPSKFPNRDGWKKEAEDFLASYRPSKNFKVKEAVRKWWFQMMYKHILGQTLTTPDAEAFCQFQSQWIRGALSSCPNWIVDNFVKIGPIAGAIWPLSKLLNEISLYRSRFLNWLPSDIPPIDRELVAQSLLEAMVFIGGTTVPLTIHCATGVLYHPDILPSPIVVNEGNVESFIFEVTRLFPAIHNFPYYVGGTRQILALESGLRDPAVWGEDANRFTMKDTSLYKEQHVGFANGAVGSEGKFQSRECPSMTMALDAAQGFVLALIAWQPTSHRSRPHVFWSPRTGVKLAPTRKQWFFDFTLATQDWLDEDQTGEWLLTKMNPIELARLLQSIGMANQPSSKLYSLLGPTEEIFTDKNRYVGACDWSTKIFFEITRSLFKDLYQHAQSASIDLTQAGQFDGYTEAKFGCDPAIKIPYPETIYGWAQAKIVPFLSAIMAEFVTDDISSDLFIDTEQDRLAAILLLQQAFQRAEVVTPPPNSVARSDSYLPKPPLSFKDITTDEAQVAIAKCGMGQLYLKRNKYDHLLSFGDVVCDVGVLGDIPVRPAFERLGAIAVFKTESSGGWQITAIEWKHGGKIVKPGEPDWEHAKWVWRCSLLTHITAVYHLIQDHWIAANAILTSSRESLGPHHPLRRLLEVVTYNTLLVNHNAALVLLPEGMFLHRMFPFPFEELTKIFKLAVDSYKWQTWPQEYKKVDLPEEIKSKLPIYEDGLEVYAAMEKFVSAYVNVYYENDAAVVADQELVNYWKFPSVAIYAKQLPALSKKALIDQVTRAIFDVTAHHEHSGYVVAYTTDPAGASPQVRPGRNMSDIQELINVNALVAGTGNPMPMFLASGQKGDEDWLFQLNITREGGYDASKFKEVSQHYATMMTELRSVSENSRRRNQIGGNGPMGSAREFPCASMDPLTFERSLSL